MLEALHRMVDLVRDFYRVPGGPGGGACPRKMGSGTCCAEADTGSGSWGIEPGPDGDAAPGAANAPF